MGSAWGPCCPGHSCHFLFPLWAVRLSSGASTAQEAPAALGKPGPASWSRPWTDLSAAPSPAFRNSPGVRRWRLAPGGPEDPRSCLQSVLTEMACRGSQVCVPCHCDRCVLKQSQTHGNVSNTGQNCLFRATRENVCERSPRTPVQGIPMLTCAICRGRAQDPLHPAAVSRWSQSVRPSEEGWSVCPQTCGLGLSVAL